ncbi:hypothetical protein ABZ801_33485 [Actinomadura sp. NPDC047616]
MFAADTDRWSDPRARLLEGEGWQDFAEVADELREWVDAHPKAPQP